MFIPAGRPHVLHANDLTVAGLHDPHQEAMHLLVISMDFTQKNTMFWSSNH
jgi:hypothetical protein